MSREAKLIQVSEPISQRAAEELLTEYWKLFPMSHAIIDTFQFVSDPATFRKKAFHGAYEIYAEPPNPDLQVFMGLRPWIKSDGSPESLILFFNRGKIAWASEYETNCTARFAEIYTGIIETGVWCYGMGNEATHGIKFSMGPMSYIYLPSELSRWFFGLMARFALQASEFHLGMEEQPRFWQGDKKDPP